MLVPLLIPAVAAAAAAAVVVDAVDEEQVEDGVEGGGGREAGSFSTVDGGAGLNLRPAMGESKDVSYQSFSFFFCEWRDVIDTLLDMRV